MTRPGRHLEIGPRVEHQTDIRLDGQIETAGFCRLQAELHLPFFLESPGETAPKIDLPFIAISPGNACQAVMRPEKAGRCLETEKTVADAGTPRNAAVAVRLAV